MATVESPVKAPSPGWARKLPADERIFIWLIMGSVAVMSAWTIGWLYLSDHNVPTAAYRTSPAAFSQQVAAFATKYGAADDRVHVPVGKDAYLMAARFTFYPTLVLKTGHPYRIWMSSVDTLHGFSLVGGGQNINLEIAPNHAYGATFVPSQPGKYLIVCNEFCGLGHERMQGVIYVER